MKKALLFVLMIIFAVSAKSQEISLNGKWSFAIDPTNVGEQNGWHQPQLFFEDGKMVALLAAVNETLAHSYNVQIPLK